MPVAVAKEPLVIQMRAKGMRVTEIAAVLDCAGGSVHQTLNKESVIAAIHDESAETTKHQIAEAGALGLRVLMELAQGMPDDNGRPALEGGTVTEHDDGRIETSGGRLYAPAAVRRSAASDLCDRAGITKEMAIRMSTDGKGAVIVVPVAGMTPEQLRAAAYPEETEDTPE